MDPFSLANDARFLPKMVLKTSYREETILCVDLFLTNTVGLIFRVGFSCDPGFFSVMM